MLNPAQLSAIEQCPWCRSWYADRRHLPVLHLVNASQVLHAHDVLFVGDVPVEDVVSAALDLIGVPTPVSMRATCTAASG